MHPKTTTTEHPDHELLALIQRHDQAWAEIDRLAREDEDHPRIRTLGTECIDLELRIIATPVRTSVGLAGKRRVIVKTGFIGEGGNPPTGDVTDLVETILALDAERAAA